MSTWMDRVQPYTIAHAKLERVIALVRESCRYVSSAEIRAFILADRPAGDEYQRWLDAAGAPLIAEWVIAQTRA